MKANPQLEYRMPSNEERRRIIHEAYQLRQQTNRKMLAAYRDAKKHRETIAILRALDDHTLRDIGIDRSEIVSVVHDPSRQRHRYFE